MSTFGSNAGFVDELYQRWLEDPSSVSEAWREFFADHPQAGAPMPEGTTPVPRAAKPTRANGESVGGEAGFTPAEPRGAGGTQRRASASEPTSAVPAPGGPPDQIDVALEPLKGISGKIAENMVASLEVPTATSFRSIPVKLMDENRRVINQHQELVSGPKVSFTHLIAWAIVRAIDKHPGMNHGYAEKDGQPHRLVRPKLNLGLAIDLEKKGERVLLVPNLKDATRFEFPSFIAAYNDLIAKARANKLAVDDFKDTTVTLTNPGMLGTLMSVPRLMQGQGTIVGAGSIGFPPEYAGMAPEVISELGLSKVMNITSTYDHRIIQGAESGAFCATLEKLLLGHDGFYERMFHELGVPHEPLAWSGDQNPPAFAGAGVSGNTDAIKKQAMVLQLIRAHRVRGHLYADLDPLDYDPSQTHPELELSTYGLSVWDLDRKFIAGGLAGEAGLMPLREILDILRQTYCRNIGVEYMHIPDGEARQWLQDRMEQTRNAEPISTEQQLRILGRLNAAEAFERFLHTTYVGHKRFSLEGAETLIPMLDALFDGAGIAGTKSAVVGMAHRGRLNVLTNAIGKSFTSVFREFEGDIDPEAAHGSGDVKYHLGAKGTYKTTAGQEVQLILAANPSHLEAVNPVVEGMARALQNRARDTERRQVLPVLIHGDAAFSGQGVVFETLGLSNLKGYTTGGSVHIVVNNQIGFTTAPSDSRSSLYCTDVAKSVHAPIFHVNGDYPEDAVRVIKLAFEYRQRYHRDVVIDMVCYRRWGHNEGDDPSYTNPVMYARIEKRRSVRKLYTEQLLRRGDINLQTAEQKLAEFQHMLQAAHDEVRAALGSKKPEARKDLEDVEGSARPPDARTATTKEVVERVLVGLDKMPEGFQPHPKLIKQLQRRREHVETGKIEWGLAETLAFGSLVLDGLPVRLSGEDSGRGTFSQRHAKLYDYKTGAPYIPLNNIEEGQGRFSVYDSHLSEFAVLGFEYGYSALHPEALVMWEAQFGDFSNGGQVIIDQFIASGEEKWGLKGHVALLLPHGYEGQGPEHSSARIERFLQLSARGNWRVAYPSTPASYFHLLRRQGLSPEKKPLVIFTPKSLLRLPECTSTVQDLTTGNFREVVDDPEINGHAPRRVLLCSGKVYYDLSAFRRERGQSDVAVVRLEQYYPFPAAQLQELLSGKYAGVKDIVWVQEEPRNMGAWDFLDDLVRRVLGPGQTVRYVGRPVSPSPATGSLKRHQAEQQALVEEAFATHVVERAAEARVVARV